MKLKWGLCLLIGHAVYRSKVYVHFRDHISWFIGFYHVNPVLLTFLPGSE